MNETADALRSPEPPGPRGRRPRPGRRVGSIMCVHFHDRPLRSPADAEPSDPTARALFHLDMLDRGFYLARRGFISPSLALEPKDYDAFAAAFEDFLDTYGAVLAG